MTEPVVTVIVDVYPTALPDIYEFAVSSDSTFELQAEHVIDVLQGAATYIKDHPEGFTP